MKTLILFLMLLAAVIISCNKVTEVKPADQIKSAPVNTTDIQKNQAPVMNYLSPQKEGC